MKVAPLLVCTFVIKNVICASIQAPLSIISLDDLTESERKILEQLDLNNWPPRPKRSSSEALSAIKEALANSIKSKLGMIAKGSASKISHLSSSSSGKYHHDVPETYDHKSFDFWNLKKSILNTLLQAVKAIKGGVLAVKGQLIKGSGYLISGSGKLISAKGEAVTKLGKNIATSALLSPSHVETVGYDHGHYHHHPDEYISPSAPSPDFDDGTHHHYHYPQHHEDSPSADQAGILIIKKIPKHGHSSHLPVEHKVPSFKPLKHAGPSFGTIIGKFFKASTSLKPGEPAPFDDHDVYYPESAHSHSDHEDHHEEPFSSNVKYHESPPPSDEEYPENSPISFHKHHNNPPHSLDEYNDKENPSLIYHKDTDIPYKKHPEKIMSPDDNYHQHIPEIYYRHKSNPPSFYEKYNIKDKEIPPPLSQKSHSSNVSPQDNKYHGHLSDIYHNHKDNPPVSYHKFHKKPSSSHDDGPSDHHVHYYETPPPDHHEYLPPSKPTKSNKNILKPPSTSYGSPFEEEPEYLHQDTSESKESVSIQLPGQQPSLSPTQLSSSTPVKSNNNQPLPSSYYLSESEIRNFPNIIEPSNTPLQYFTDDSILSSALPPISSPNASTYLETAFKTFSTMTPIIETPANQVIVPSSPETKHFKTANFPPIAVFPTHMKMSFENLPTVSPTNAVPNFIVPLHPNVQQLYQRTFPSPVSNNQNLGPSPRVSPSSSSQASNFKHPENNHPRPARSKNSVRRRFPSYEVIKSVSFQLGNNRLKRL